VPVLVIRCTEKPAVPSHVVVCAVCGADCWLSDYSGAATMRLAEQLGSPEIVCEPCFESQGIWHRSETP
jgi:hypothetical protein